MRKRYIPEKSQDDETWLMTYGDMMTLLLVFFVLLYAISTMNKTNVNDVVNSMSNAFGKKDITQEEKDLMALRDSLGLKDKMNIEELEDLKKVLSSISNIVQKESLEKSIDLSIDNRGVVIRASESLFFRSGQAAILQEGQQFLYRIYPILQKSPYNILVEGHTDNIPIKTRDFPSNWELSVNRATKVVRFFIEKCQLPAQRFSAMGFAEFRPIAENDSDENRAKNRRVEIIVLRTRYQERTGNE